MAERAIAMYPSMLMLVGVGLVYGTLFNRRKNYLLGYEWYLLGISACLGMLFLAGVAPVFGTAWHFLDMFSRLVGVTIIGSLGLLQVTHRLRLSARTDVLIFAAGTAGTLFFMGHPGLEADFVLLTYLSAVLFFGLLLLMAWRLLKLGRTGHGAAFIAIVLANGWVSVFPDFLVLGADGLPVELFHFIAAHLVWAVSFAGIYHGYVALEDTSRHGGGA